MIDHETRYDREVDRLWRLLQGGRITEEEFDRLSRNLDRWYFREVLREDIQSA